MGRLAISKRAASSTWGPDSRIASITTHAFLESAIDYGLAVMGTQTSHVNEDRTGSQILAVAVRRTAGTGFAASWEIIRVFADTESDQCCYISKKAIT